MHTIFNKSNNSKMENATNNSSPMLSRVYSTISSGKFWIYLFIVFIFIAVSIYTYKKYVTPMVDEKYKDNQEFLDKPVEDKKVAELYMFIVDWCPHSKIALPIWQELKTETEGKLIHNYQVVFNLVNGEEQSDLADKFKVDGFTTIKLVKGNQIIEYDAKPDLKNLKEFLNSVLQGN